VFGALFGSVIKKSLPVSDANPALEG